MMRCSGLVVLAAFLATASLARATTINIVNGDFEYPTIANSVSDGGWYFPTKAGVDPTSYGWAGDGDSGISNGVGAGDLLAHGGSNWAGINNDGTSKHALSQLLKIGSNALSVQVGDKITINAFESRRNSWVGQVDSNYPTLSLRVGIWAGGVNSGTLLGSQTFNASDYAAGTWAQHSFTYTAQANAVGQSLYLELKNVTPYVALSSQSIRQVNIDDVSGTFTAAPEPSTLAIVASGLIGLLAYAWRKRK